MTEARKISWSRGMVAALFFGLLAAGGPIRSQALTDDDKRMPLAPMHEQVLSLPGDPARPVMLEVTLFTPSGPGPFPLAVMNHGATDASGSNRGERYRTTVSADYFLSRGYAVALPMMRGFSRSGGSIVHAGCDLAGVAEANARDIAAVTTEIERRPEIDRTHVVIAGQSFGAWNTLGVGTNPPAGVRALVLFNAALRASDCPRQDEAMVDAGAAMGGHTGVPSLFIYGDNDSVMPHATWDAVYSRYSLAGARADLFDVGRWGPDSHQLLSDPTSLPRWAPRIDVFLARSGLPAQVVAPEYLPHPAPPATNFAALEDVAAVPLVADSGRAVYRRFLAAKPPRAFVIGPNGGLSMSSGGYDPLGLALRECARAGVLCQPYAVDDAVVWTGGAGSRAAMRPAAMRIVAKTVKSDRPTVLGAFFELNPDCTPKGLPTVQITSAPTHGSAVSGPRPAHPAFPASSPFATCNNAPVDATGVVYTPIAGYAGPDTLELTETAPSGKRQVIRLALTVAHD